MSAKRDNRKMLEMLERMGMVKKELASEIGATPSVPMFSSVAPSPAGVPAEAPTPVLAGAPPAPSPAVQAPAGIPSASGAAPAMPGADAGRYPLQGEAQNLSFHRNADVLGTFSEKTFWDETQPPAQNLDGYSDVDMLYHAFGMKTGGIDTIFLIAEYLKTLPDSLPAELRRSIIARIVSASGFDFEAMLNDGIDRVTKLNEYASAFSSRSEELISRHTAEIEALEAQIERVREIIAERRNLHKRQFLAIEDEAQRLKDVLDFFTK